MKRLLTLVAFFATVQASAQQVNPVPDYVFSNRMSAGRNTVTDTAAYFSIGPRYGATRGMMPPMVVDTASFSANKRNGLLIFSVQKNKFLYWDSVGVKWAEMAGTGGTAISSGDTAAMLAPYLRKSDTTAMLTQYVRNKDNGTTGNIPKYTSTKTIDDSQLFDDGTNIGVGTSTPAAKLTIVNGTSTNPTAATSDVPLFLRINGVTSTETRNSIISQIYTASSTDQSNHQLLFINANNSSYSSGAIAYINDGSFVFRTAGGNVSANTLVGTERMRVFSNGRVGINTSTDAGYQLDVSGNLRTTTGANFATSSGNIGIGTTTVNSKLHITTATGTAQTLGDWANSIVIIQGASRTGTTSVGGSYATTLNLQSNDDVISAGTGASIGFQAKWNTGIYGSAAQFASIFGGKETSTDGDLSGYISFATRPSGGNPTERMRVNSSGELIIGTTSDAGSYSLQVSGNSLFSGNIRTAAPSGGTANDWRLGTVASVSPTSPNRTIEVSIGGTIYYIAAKTTND